MATPQDQSTTAKNLHVLPAGRYLRLRIKTKLQATPKGLLANTTGPWGALTDGKAVKELEEYAFFRTEGPPGLADLALPRGTEATDETALRECVSKEDPKEPAKDTAKKPACEVQLIDVQGYLKPKGAQPSFKSALNSLDAYVWQTVPGSGPADPKLPPEGPVFRHQDVAVDFRRAPVRALYASVRRDLSLQVLDGTGRVVANARGQRTADPVWSSGDASPADQVDLATLGSPPRLSLEKACLPAATALTARLVPHLLWERFDDKPGEPVGNIPAGWSSDGGAWQRQAVSATTWQVIQTEAGPDPGSAPDDVEWPNCRLLYEGAGLAPVDPRSPYAWTDYRVSVTLGADVGKETDGAIGLLFRATISKGALDAYWFSMHRADRRWRLTRLKGTSITVLAENNSALVLGRPYHVAVECIGPAIRVFVDGRLVFDVKDLHPDDVVMGTVGLATRFLSTGRFTSVRVQDYRANAPTLKRFAVRTGPYASLTHLCASHLGGWTVDLQVEAKKLADEAAKAVTPGNKASEEKAAKATLEAGKDLSAELKTRLQKSVAVDGLAAGPSHEEGLAFEDAWRWLFDRAPPLRGPAQGVETVWLAGKSGPAGLLVRFPTPMDWRRLTVQLQQCQKFRPLRRPAGPVRFLGCVDASSEGSASLRMIAMQSTDLEGFLLQRLHVGDPTTAPASGTPLLAETSKTPAAGRLLKEVFRPGMLWNYELSSGKPPAEEGWEFADGVLRCGKELYGQEPQPTGKAANDGASKQK